MTARQVFEAFYRTARMGVGRSSDGGGPFGFDVTVALQVDHLIGVYGCDGVVETGCHRGDTTAYLASAYRGLPVVTCDIDPGYAAFTRRRLRAAPNVVVVTGDSAEVLPGMLAGLARPLVYLDAHWRRRWPLAAELAATAGRGVVAVDDVDIGHTRFGYDTYDGRVCGPELLRELLPERTRMWVGDPYGDYPLPCLQVGRRSGVAYLPPDDGPPPQAGSWFRMIPLRPEVVRPRWPQPARAVTRPMSTVGAGEAPCRR